MNNDFVKNVDIQFIWMILQSFFFIFLFLMGRDLSKKMPMCRWKNMKKILKWRTKNVHFEIINESFFFPIFFRMFFFFIFIADMNVSTIWITFNVVIESATNADGLQIWIIICSIGIIVSLLSARIAWTARGDPELAVEFHWFFYQIDCFHSDIDFDLKCRIRETSHHFEMMKNKMKIFYWFSNVDCV